MRIRFVLLSVAALLVAVNARAADDAKALLEKAIKAHGGEEKLAKYKAGSIKGKGKITLNGAEVELLQEASYMMPDKVKEVTELEIMGNKYRSVTIINGDKVSLEVNGMAIEIKDALKDAMDDARKRLQLSRLIPLRDKKFELSSVGESKVLDKPAVGIRVSAKGMKDVNLYFDMKTNLLVKIEGRAIDPMNGQEITEERILTDYKTVDGMPMPKKALVNRDGKKFLELDIEEMKFLEKIDDAEFKKE